MRLAFLTPLPPAASGIADYSADVLALLAPRHEIDVFHDQGAVDRDRLPVSCDIHPLPKTLSLEGLVYRVLPAAPRQDDNPTVMARNLEKLYRMESATSVATNWEQWSSLRMLSLNYASAYLRLGMARAKSGDLPGARRLMIRALELNEFHHGSIETAKWIISSWSGWDTKSPDLARWKKKLNL